MKIYTFYSSYLEKDFGSVQNFFLNFLRDVKALYNSIVDALDTKVVSWDKDTTGKV